MSLKRSFLYFSFPILLFLFSACDLGTDQSLDDFNQLELVNEDQESVVEEINDSVIIDEELHLGEKIIENASLNYETNHFEQTITFINEQLELFETSLESSSKGQASSSYGFVGNYISMTIRLPHDSLHPFIAELNNYADLYLQNEEISRVDITKEVRDNETRLAVLKEEEDALRELLQEQGSLEEILQIRTRLSEVISEREIYENENKYYKDQADFSTIYLYVQEADRANVRNLGSFWDRINSAFVDSFYRFITVTQNLMVGFIYFVPYLVVLIITILIVYFILRYLHKNK